RHLATLADRAPAPLQDVLSNVAARRRRAHEADEERAHAATGEARRSLGGAILLAPPLGDSHVILVTSATGGPRSSTLAAGLARALAMAGQDTLALSTDLASTDLAD